MRFVNAVSLSTVAFTAFIGLCGTAAPAAAGAITYDFTLDQCSSGGCGLSNYGSVLVTDIVGGGVTVHVSLLGGSGLVHTGALSQHTMVFNLAGSPAIDITGLPSAAWTYTAQTSFTPSSGFFGTFNTLIDCNAACGPSAPYTAPLDFTITTTSITTASFLNGGTAANAFFVADISNPNGDLPTLTGRIGATTGVDINPLIPVPEPLTVSLFGAGIAGLVASRRRKKVLPE